MHSTETQLFSGDLLSVSGHAAKSKTSYRHRYALAGSLRTNVLLLEVLVCRSCALETV